MGSLGPTHLVYATGPGSRGTKTRRAENQSRRQTARAGFLGRASEPRPHWSGKALEAPLESGARPQQKKNIFVADINSVHSSALIHPNLTLGASPLISLLPLAMPLKTQKNYADTARFWQIFQK